MRTRACITTLIVFCLAGPTAIFGFEPSLSGEATIGAAAAQSEDFAWTQLYAENRLQLDAAVGDVWLTAEAFLESSPLESAPHQFRLGELYLDWAHESGNITLGRQIIAWGRMDALSILNLISPPDSERMFVGRGSPDPLPLLAVQWIRDIPNGMLELLYIPLSPYPNGRAPESNSDMLAGTSDLSLDQGEAGIRLRWFLPFADTALSLFSGRDRRPVIAGLPPEIAHHRLHVLGIDAAVPVGSTVIRLESGLFPKRRFTPAEPGHDPARATQLQGAIGIDWLPENWRFIAEARSGIRLQQGGIEEDYLIDYGAEVSRTMRQGEIELSLLAMYQQHHDNLYLQAGTLWQPPAGPAIELGVEYLRGDEGLFALRENGAIPYLRLRLEY